MDTLDRKHSGYLVQHDVAHHKQGFLTVEEMDQSLVKMKYAVRGAVVDKAAEMKNRLAKGEKLPFDEIILCNIGNPHAVMQKPITFYRQVAACCMCPSLCTGDTFPTDVRARAQEYLAATGGNGMGAYTGSTGLPLVRKQVADFIERRDGFPSDPESIELHTGASEGVKRCLDALVAKPNDVVMIPRPQYPLYSAALTMFSGKAQYYNCVEESDWSVTREELERAFTEGTGKGVNDVRAICVINPGNPTGAVLPVEDIRMFISFARDKQIAILADEVYQVNIYDDDKQFHSFKKVLRQMQQADPTYKDVQLLSFHSTSKGIIGECGLRGGYTEFVGFSDSVLGIFSKVASTSLASNTLGQVMMGLMVAPPAKGDPSFPLFEEETTAIFNGLKERSQLLTDGLNAIPGISTRKIQGAMYAFAKVEIPPKAVAKAAELGFAPDELWCLELVEKTGIVCVPGSGFGQAPGTYHFRITILPPTEKLKGMLARLRDFQADFLKTGDFTVDVGAKEASGEPRAKKLKAAS